MTPPSDCGTGNWSADCARPPEDSVGDRARLARLFAQLVRNELVADELIDTPWQGPSRPSTVEMHPPEPTRGPST